MKNKLMLLLSIVIISITCTNSFALKPEFKPFIAKPLGYSYNALEPYIDEETIKLNYNNYYLNYLNNLNETTKTYPELYNAKLYELLICLDCLPESSSLDIKNNGGGVYNHELYFDIMTCKKTSPSGKLKSSIIRDFGSINKFKKEFKQSALNLSSSGWTWLVSNPDGKLSIVNTFNQGNPISLNLNPIICIDMWEHAYYLSYKDNKGKYIDNWFKVLDWDKALENYCNSK